MSNIIKTPLFRLSFPKIFEPEVRPDGTKRYTITMLFPVSEDISELKRAAYAVGIEKFGKKAMAQMEAMGIKSPFRPGETCRRKADGQIYAGYEGMIAVRATSKNPPKVVGPNGLPLEQSELYPGCWCKAAIVPFAYKVQVNQGLGFALLALAKIKDDEPLGGAMVDPEEFFRGDLQREMDGSPSPIPQTDPFGGQAAPAAPAPQAPQPAQDAQGGASWDSDDIPF